MNGFSPAANSWAPDARYPLLQQQDLCSPFSSAAWRHLQPKSRSRPPLRKEHKKKTFTHTREKEVLRAFADKTHRICVQLLQEKCRKVWWLRPRAVAHKTWDLLSQWIVPTDSQTELLLHGINSQTSWIYFTWTGVKVWKARWVTTFLCISWLKTCFKKVCMCRIFPTITLHTIMLLLCEFWQLF